MRKLGQETEWCPTCGCICDGNGVWAKPSGVRTYSVSDAGEVVVCAEHQADPNWGKTEREIFDERKKR